jgi:signal transduction histidine kinase
MMEIKAPMNQVEERYFQILQRVVLAPGPDSIELQLNDAFELGRDMVGQGVAPDEVTYIHHQAIVRLSLSHPLLILAQVADRLTMPLMEMSMAYGMSFRELAERRYQTMVNARLEQSHKLEALGTLAAGIAHDFNNLLGSIVGFAELAEEDLPEGSSGKRSIQQILIASFRARDLVVRMLTFARHIPSTPVLIDVVAQIRETMDLLSISHKENLEIRFETAFDQAMVVADPGQLQQIVMNLCINAADAMNHKGVVAIRLDKASLDDNRYSEGTAGICLSVADSGSGMTPEVQERIFDPFFTTKAPGKGSGLGLSVVHGIISQLGGFIEVQSRSSGGNSGTEFRVYLPLAKEGGIPASSPGL